MHVLSCCFAALNLLDRLLKEGFVRFVIKEFKCAYFKVYLLKQTSVYLRIFDIEAPLKSYVTGINQFKMKNAFFGVNFLQVIQPVPTKPMTTATARTTPNITNTNFARGSRHFFTVCCTDYDMKLPHFTSQIY